MIGLVSVPAMTLAEAVETHTAVQLDDPDFYDARVTCGAPPHDGKYGHPTFDQLFAA
jgi:hypothetical protein